MDSSSQAASEVETESDAEWWEGEKTPPLRISSSIFTTPPILGRWSAATAVQLTAICSIVTISPSIPLYRISSRSNTSEVHSSRTTDRTHPGRSAPSTTPSPTTTAGFPVSNSSSTTPKAYTSARCDAHERRLSTGDSGARYPPVRQAADVGPNNDSPASESRALPALSRRMLVDLMLPWANLGDRVAPW